MTGGGEAPARARHVGILLLLLAFAAGALGGVSVERYRHARRDDFRGIREMGSGRGRGPFGRGMMRRGELPPFFDRLDLTPDQRTRIKTIFEEAGPRMDSLTQQTWPALQAMFDSTRARVHEILTPVQRERLDSLNREARSRWPSRGPERRDAPPPMPPSAASPPHP